MKLARTFPAALCAFLFCAFPMTAGGGEPPSVQETEQTSPKPPPAGAKTENAAVLENGARQPGEEFFSELKQVLNMNIAARVSETGEEAVWRVESSRNTVSGRGVSVKLVGDNIVILADFTPYVDADSSVMLVAQGHVWISPDGGEPLKYLSALKSIPVRMGEKVLFFPLGVKSLEATSDTTYNIELEIEVVPADAAKAETRK